MEEGVLCICQEWTAVEWDLVGWLIKIVIFFLYIFFLLGGGVCFFNSMASLAG